jgi:hypothetical protein
LSFLTLSYGYPPMRKSALHDHITALNEWSKDPQVDTLGEIMDRIPDAELLAMISMMEDGSPEARIVWIEYAKRRKLLTFELQTSRLVDGSNQLTAMAAAKPVHRGVAKKRRGEK